MKTIIDILIFLLLLPFKLVWFILLGIWTFINRSIWDIRIIHYKRQYGKHWKKKYKKEKKVKNG